MPTIKEPTWQDVLNTLQTLSPEQLQQRAIFWMDNYSGTVQTLDVLEAPFALFDDYYEELHMADVQDGYPEHCLPAGTVILRVEPENFPPEVMAMTISHLSESQLTGPEDEE
ncbi:hypothetical protein [Hymenobacter sp. BT491]|uniref:hypothetical protein n=1 Tax=Hymenobacter sp. BT491 TaxID=2766779 RepID=UPI001653D854|nr:hypothetical protein [Hymenobacter sp. BT491]MBC6988979.1 hypothetical protein [Hymenobacter sp. BT491]